MRWQPRGSNVYPPAYADAYQHSSSNSVTSAYRNADAHPHDGTTTIVTHTDTDSYASTYAHTYPCAHFGANTHTGKHLADQDGALHNVRQGTAIDPCWH